MMEAFGGGDNLDFSMTEVLLRYADIKERLNRFMCVGSSMNVDRQTITSPIVMQQ